MTDDAGTVLVALRRIVRFLRLADRDAEHACGLSAAQLFVLNTLAESPAPSLADLADRTLTDPSSVSSVVAKLVERGYVTRRPSRTDRRRAELRLTASGTRIARTAPRMPQLRIIEAIRAMPPRRRAELARVFEAFAGAIGAHEVAPRMLFEDEPRRKTEKRGLTPISAGRQRKGVGPLFLCPHAGQLTEQCADCAEMGTDPVNARVAQKWGLTPFFVRIPDS